MSLREKVQNHPLIVVAAAYVAGASMAWVVANEVLVKPRDYDLQRQRETIAELSSRQLNTEIVEHQQSSPPHPGVETTQADSVSALSPIAIEVFPHLTLTSYESTIRSLRKSKNLRELTALESGNPASKTPFGTYFFVQSGYIEVADANLQYFWARSPVQRFVRYRDLYFEVFCIDRFRALLLGFVSDEAVASVSSLSGTTIKKFSLSPIPWGQMRNLVILPMNRRVASRDRQVSVEESENVYILDMSVR